MAFPLTHRCVLLALACALASCGDASSEDVPTSPPGLRALRVLGCDQGLRVEFAADVQAATVTSQTFLVERSTGTVSYDPAGRTATYVPLDPFTSGELYTAVLTEEITSTSGERLPEPLRWQFSCVDRAAPVLVERTPLGDEHSPLVRPTLRFSEPLDEATLTPGNVRIDGVESTLKWDAAERTLTLEPVRALYPGRGYSVSVSSKVRDVSGNALGTDVTWSFRTREATDDWAVKLVSPPIPDAASCDAPIELRVASHVEVDPEAFATPPVLVDGSPGSIAQWDPIERIIRVSPTVPLRPGTSYPLVATTALRDRFGDALFDDHALIADITVVDDCAQPTVSSVPAAWNSVACDAPIPVGFSTLMDETTVLIELRDLVAGGWDPLTSPVVESQLVAGEDTSVFELLPTQPLVAGRRYWLSVAAGAESLDGATTPLSGGWELLASCE